MVRGDLGGISAQHRHKTPQIYSSFTNNIPQIHNKFKYKIFRIKIFQIIGVNRKLSMKVKKK